MEPPTPAVVELALRLRQLREERWPDVRLTQSALAKALGGEDPLAPATVSSWESSAWPKMPPRSRITAYARFFSTRRSIEAEPRLLSFQDLTEDEKEECAKLESELLGLRAAARKPPLAEEVAVRSWQFLDTGPVTIVCAELPANLTGSFADPADPNYTELQSYADLDALVELHGHIRAENPAMTVTFKASSQVIPDDLTGHVILLGGIAWNRVTERLSAMVSLPVRQVIDAEVESGEIFTVEDAGRVKRFLPKWRDKNNELAEDVGLLARTPNPLNSNRTLTICNGIHSRGVLGAVRSLTDARIRDSNERYIMEKLADSHSFSVLMRVPVISGKVMSPDFNTPGSIFYQWSSGDT
jgi:hypothetical protein